MRGAPARPRVRWQSVPRPLVAASLADLWDRLRPFTSRQRHENHDQPDPQELSAMPVGTGTTVPAW